MPRPLQDFVALIAYLFFGGLEIIVTWAPFVLAVCVPTGIAWSMGARTGDDVLVGALVVGLTLMGGWYFYLDNGAGKRIEKYFRALTHSTIRRLGAGDAIHSDS